MDTIPEELLAEIFSWCDLGPFPNRDPFRPATIPILNVCRSWRRIALSTPPLWTSIKIFSSYFKISGFKSGLDRFLRLSKNSLLDLYLCFQQTESVVVEPLSPQILKELGQIWKTDNKIFARDREVLQLMNAMGSRAN